MLNILIVEILDEIIIAIVVITEEQTSDLRLAIKQDQILHLYFSAAMAATVARRELAQ